MALTLPTLTATDVQTADLKAVFADFDVEQEKYREEFKKYKQFKPLAEGEKITEVHEYLCPDGSVGYQVFVTAVIDKKTMVKSFGKGREASSRDFDWTEVKEEKI